MSQTRPHPSPQRSLRSPSPDPAQPRPLAPTRPPSPPHQHPQITPKKEEKADRRSFPPGEEVEGCSCGRGRGETQLLLSRCGYLRRDNELLQNQIIYLNEHIHQLTLALGRMEGQARQQVALVAEAAKTQLQQMSLKVGEALRLLQNKQQQMDSRITEVVFTVKKSKLKVGRYEPHAKQQSAQLSTDHVKLIERIRALEQELQNRSTQYLKNFEWKPQHIPSFAFRDRTNLESLTTPLKLPSYSGPSTRTQHKREPSQYLDLQRMRPTPSSCTPLIFE